MLLRVQLRRDAVSGQISVSIERSERAPVAFVISADTAAALGEGLRAVASAGALRGAVVDVFPDLNGRAAFFQPGTRGRV